LKKNTAPFDSIVCLIEGLGGSGLSYWVFCIESHLTQQDAKSHIFSFIDVLSLHWFDLPGELAKNEQPQ